MEFKVIARKWGSSIGVVIPKNLIEVGRIKENDEIVIEIKRKPQVKELFGAFPKWKSNHSAQELKDGMRNEWD